MAQHTWTFSCIYSSLLHLWLFGVLETAVVLIHRDKLITGAVLTMPYLIMLSLTVIAAVTGCAEWIRRLPLPRSARVAMPGLVRGLQAAFVVVVGFIAAVVLYGPASVHDGRYFPVPLTSLRSARWACSTCRSACRPYPYSPSRERPPWPPTCRGTIVPLIVIVIATLLYLGSFHFSGRPRRIVYLGTYLVVLAGTAELA